MWIYLSLHFSIILTALIPGYLFYENFFPSEKDSKEHILTYSFGLGLLILGVTQFISFLFAKNLSLTNTFIMSIILGSLTLRIFLCKVKLRSPWSWTFLSFTFFSLFCLILISLLPSYFVAYKSDWSLYYPNVAHYVLEKPIEFYQSGLSMEYLVRRTPFFSLINAFFLSYIGNTYAYFQVISSVMNSLLFWVILILAHQFYGKKISAFVLLLLPLIPSLTYNIGLPTPKAIVIFFILLCFIAYNRFLTSQQQWKDSGLLAVCMCTAYMIHPSSLFYIMWLFIHQAYLLTKKQTTPPWRFICSCIIAGLLIIILWYVWGLVTLGADKILVPTYTISEIKLSIFDYITSRLTILFTTLFIPITEPMLNAIKNPSGPLNESQYLILWGNYWVRANVETFFGGYGFIASTFFLISTYFYRKPIPSSKLSFPLILSILGAAIYLGAHFLIDHKGLAIGIMGPVVTP